MDLDFKRLALKITRAILLLVIIIFFILLITSIPKDFDIRYFRGNYEATHSFMEILELMKQNILSFLKGEIAGVQVEGKTVQEIFVVSFLRSITVLIFSLTISLFLGLILGVLVGALPKRNQASSTLAMLPMSVPDVFTISVVQFFALYLFRNKIKFFGIGPIQHKGDEFWYSSIFPIIAISIIPIFHMMVTVIKTIELEQRKPYVLALRGKGMAKSYIIRVHMRKIIIFNLLSTMPSVLTIMFSSLIIVENIFFYRGMGYQMINIFRSTKVTPGESQALFTYFLIMMAIFYFLFYGILNIIKRFALPDLNEEL